MVPIHIGICFSFSMSHPETPTTPSQALTILFEALRINSETITTSSEPVIIPSDSEVLRLSQLSEVHLYTLQVPFHHPQSFEDHKNQDPLLAPRQTNTIELNILEIMLSKGLPRLC